MTKKAEIEAEYREIELYLKQAQDELGQAISNLSLNNGNDVAPAHSTDGSTAECTTASFRRPKPQNVDFLSIFAQHDLVADYSNLEVALMTSGERNWNYTLPSSFRKKKKAAERPQTLTPPPRFVNSNPFRNKDWRAYVEKDLNNPPAASSSNTLDNAVPVQNANMYFRPVENAEQSTVSAAPKRAAESHYSVVNPKVFAKRMEYTVTAPIPRDINLNHKDSTVFQNHNGDVHFVIDSAVKMSVPTAPKPKPMPPERGSSTVKMRNGVICSTFKPERTLHAQTAPSQHKKDTLKSQDDHLPVEKNKSVASVQPAVVALPKSPRMERKEQQCSETAVVPERACMINGGTQTTFSLSPDAARPLSPRLGQDGGLTLSAILPPPPDGTDPKVRPAARTRSAERKPRAKRKKSRDRDRDRGGSPVGRSHSLDKARSPNPEDLPSITDRSEDYRVSRSTQTYKGSKSDTVIYARHSSGAGNKLSKEVGIKGASQDDSNVPCAAVTSQHRPTQQQPGAKQPKSSQGPNPISQDTSSAKPSAASSTLNQSNSLAKMGHKSCGRLNGVEGGSTRCDLEDCRYCALPNPDSGQQQQQQQQPTVQSTGTNPIVEHQADGTEASDVSESCPCLPPPPVADPACPACQACAEGKYVEMTSGPLVIPVPSREARRLRSRPQMPVIEEDVAQKSNDEFDYVTETSSAASTLRKSHYRSLSNSSSGTTVSVSDEAPRSPGVHSTNSESSFVQPPPGSPTSNSSGGSLLDTLHKKYYPDQYKRRTKARSAEALLMTVPAEIQHTPYMYSPRVTHSKSASFTSDRKAKLHPDRLSDGAVSAKLPVSRECSRTPSPQSVGSSVSPSSGRKLSGGHSPSPSPTLMFANPNRSPEVLRSCTHECRHMRFTGVDLTGVRTDREIAEIEAVEACKWLRAAGFPQYAQMYEDHLFPIEVSSVEKDHDFLDKDSILSLFRRLQTLNKCARMKIDAPPRKTVEDSDEEDQCALSDKWKYQRSSRRWSRKDLDLLPGFTLEESTAEKSAVRSSSSHDSLLSDNDESFSQQEDSPTLGSRSPHESRSPRDKIELHLDLPLPNHVGEGEHNGSVSPSLRRVASERFRGATKNFFKRIESLKDKKSSPKRKFTGEKLEISNPVLMDSPEVQERMARLGCVELSPSSELAPITPDSGLPMSQGTDSQTGISELESSPTPVTSGELDVTQIKQSPACAHRSLSNNDVEEFYTVGADYKPGAFPKLISNGYIDAGHGNQLNCRTGSFSSGYDPATDVVRRRPTAHSQISHLEKKAESRLSVYDNVPEVDAQHELDLILHDLLTNISGLNQSLGEEFGGTELDNAVIQELQETSAQVHQEVVKASSHPSVSSTSKGVETCPRFYLETNEPSSPGAATDTTTDKSMFSQSELQTLTGSLEENDQPDVLPPPGDKSGQGKPSQGADDVIVKPCNSTQGNSSAGDGAEGDAPCSPTRTESSDVNTPPMSVVTATVSAQEAQEVRSRSVSSQDSHKGHAALSASNSDAASNDHVFHRPSTPSEPPSTLPHLEAGVNECKGSLSDDEVFSGSPTSQDSAAPTGENAEGLDQDHISGGSSSNHESDADTPESREESAESPEARERRDSGVGSSLTRAPSDRRRHRIRWHSFVKSHRPSLNSQNLQISGMSVGQLMVLRKLCLLKVTALMERYSPTNRTGWNWMMPKFIKRFRAPDYKDKNVFGVPLLVTLQRTSQPLPQCILCAMRCLRRTAQDSVGIFRKSGVRSRIQKLRNDIEESPESADFESLHAYDVADLLKLYFRELPECLLTNKLSETFISIFTYVPEDERLEAVQASIMLMPDEHREVLQCLLLFLSDMAQHADKNQMTASNLAVCFAPSLFHMCGPKSNPTASPKRARKQMGVPDQKELLDQKAAHQCLCLMIAECKKIFTVPPELLARCHFSYIEQGDPVPLEELGSKRSSTEEQGDYAAYMESCIQGLLKESREKFKGWVTVSSPNNTELACKKVGDGHPLRLWKCCVDVEAPPDVVLERVLRERHLWDEDLLNWRVVEKLDKNTEVFQYVLSSMAPHPTRDICELRSWRTQLPKGACMLCSTSVEHREATLMGGVRAVVLASRYLIEPCGSGKSRLTLVCRVDTRGHTPEWYNKVYGHLCANYMARIRDSFKQKLESTDGPETRL